MHGQVLTSTVALGCQAATGDWGVDAAIDDVNRAIGESGDSLVVGADDRGGTPIRISTLNLIVVDFICGRYVAHRRRRHRARGVFPRAQRP